MMTRAELRIFLTTMVKLDGSPLYKNDEERELMICYMVQDMKENEREVKQ